MWTTRRYTPADREAVLDLADRLQAGRPNWRDADRWLGAVRGWVEESTASAGEAGHAVFVVLGERGLAGFVSLGTQRHFTGMTDAYVGEFVVAEWAEGHGAGRALLAAAERWAVEGGHERLTLETGAANDRALDFYRRSGFVDEEVRLTRILPATRGDRR